MGRLLQAVSVEPVSLPDGYLWSLLRAILALALVLALAWGVLRWLAQRGFGTGRSLPGGRRLRLLERLPLDARRSVYLVEADARCFLIGAGEGEGPRLLAELPGPSPQPALDAAQAVDPEPSREGISLDRNADG
jgi:flagellar biogenesis protein FliO